MTTITDNIPQNEPERSMMAEPTMTSVDVLFENIFGPSQHGFPATNARQRERGAATSPSLRVFLSRFLQGA